MTTPTNKPSSAELRRSADFMRGRAANDRIPNMLVAGADAMDERDGLRESRQRIMAVEQHLNDQLDAMRAQRDRLAEALRKIADYRGMGPGTHATAVARAALAELQGGA